METITIKNDKLSVSKDVLEMFLNNILEEYTDFDIQLMKKYIETKDLNENRFVNI